MNKYIKYIVELFWSDTIKQLDEVLFDGAEDPEYSAVMVKNRLFAYIQVAPLLGEDMIRQNVDLLLQDAGYPIEAIQTFEQKVLQEEKVFCGRILYPSAPNNDVE